MRIGDAIIAMERAERVRRRGWNGSGLWLGLQRPDSHSKMGEPYVYIRTVHGTLIPWTCSQADLLADDYEIVENTGP